ncbi:Mediator of RNA polymerase II transcription subunit 6, partial [Fragariocoptes setiger]
MTEIKPENPLHVSWHDSAWIPMLNPMNIMDYFTQQTNPFYDRTCNNEIARMQRLDPEQMMDMIGLEYRLHLSQEPILYVIRKQHRHSPTHVQPLADYYILAGVVYQAPDLNSVISSRVNNCSHNLLKAFDECQAMGKFHPSAGHSWTFKEDQEKLQHIDDAASREAERKQRLMEPPTRFQRKVDPLLKMLDFVIQQSDRKAQPQQPKPATTPASQNQSVKTKLQTDKQASLMANQTVSR